MVSHWPPCSIQGLMAAHWPPIDPTSDTNFYVVSLTRGSWAQLPPATETLWAESCHEPLDATGWPVTHLEPLDATAFCSFFKICCISCFHPFQMVRQYNECILNTLLHHDIHRDNCASITSIQ